MTYDPSSLTPRTARLRRALSLGTRVVAGVVGIGFFKSEVQRIESLPPDITNRLYLALLAATLLLTAGWILVGDKELGILCEWLDPKAYEPPDETLVILGIAVALILLFFAARNAVWFGVTYSVYTAINLAAVIHFRKQMVDAIAKSRVRLDEESPKDASLYRAAIDLIEAYYLKRPNTARVAGTLVLALSGLSLSIIFRRGNHANLDAYSYITYLLSVLLLEGAVAFLWRAKLYAGIHPLAVSKREAERNRSTP